MVLSDEAAPLARTVLLAAQLSSPALGQAWVEHRPVHAADGSEHDRFG